MTAPNSTGPSATIVAAAPTDLPPGQVRLAGKVYMTNARGGLDPVETVKATDQLMDEVVRKVVGFAGPLSDQIARFKQHTFDDVDRYVELLAQDFGAKVGGKKGNIQLLSYDGLMKVQIAVADNVVFGPELQIAKQLFDECVTEWSADSHAHIRALISRAFNTDKAGLVNRAELLSLTRVEIDDERWNRAVDAIREAQRVIGSKRYMRVYTRPHGDAPWTPIVLDVAGAK